MKTRNRSISLVLFLTIGIITIVSFSFGCTDQGENSSTPVENNSLQIESVANTTEIVSNTSESAANTSEPVANIPNQSEPVENVSSQSESSGGSFSSQPGSSEGISSQSEPSEDVSPQSQSSEGISSQSEPPVDVSPQLEPVSADSITSIKWVWGGYRHFDSYTPVPNPENYTLSFFSDGTCYVKAECNSGNGSYILKENNLTIDSTAITTMACGPDSMDPEYLGLLASVNSVTIEDGQLILYTSEDDMMYFTSGGQSEE